MKKIILCSIFISCIVACSSSDDNIDDKKISISYNKLKAHNKVLAYYYYSSDATKNGNSRIYLDTISNIITEYTSRRETNQTDTLELFGIKSTTFYPNYKNTNVDYMSYEVINKEKTTGMIIFSHQINTDKFVFKKYKAGTPIIFSHDLSEYYKEIK